jgi:hypothetical protein
LERNFHAEDVIRLRGRVKASMHIGFVFFCYLSTAC